MATTSVSVSEVNSQPSAMSRRFRVEEVLDDAVVDQRQAAARVEHRVGVALGGRAVGRPARVAEAVAAAQVVALELLDQTVELALGLDRVELAVAHHHHAGRVVAAVLEPAQAVDQQRHDLALTEISDDAAHAFSSALACAFFRFAQPGTVRWRARSTASAPSGTSWVITDPAAVVAPAPTTTGATSIVSLPMKAPAPISVRCLATPSKLQVTAPAPMFAPLADLGVADVGEMVGLGAAAEPAAS